MENVIIDIIKWLIPVGAGSSALAYVVNRAIRELRLIKESHDTFNEMYMDVKEALQLEVAEKRQLRAQVAKLERAIATIFNCKYSSACPVESALRVNNLARPRTRGQPKRESRSSTHKIRDDSDDEEHC